MTPTALMIKKYAESGALPVYTLSQNRPEPESLMQSLCCWSIYSRWMDDLRFYTLFNSNSVISG